LDNTVYAIAVAGSDIYVGGRFTEAGSNPDANRILLWNGSSWVPLGNGLNSSVNAIAVEGSNVYAGGYFTNAGGHPRADSIVRWGKNDFPYASYLPLTKKP
jgi:hypothetical protein